jgi:LysR family transcriptional activator of mexEF-oprN operon
LFLWWGRGLALAARGARLHAAIRPHLQALVEAALAPEAFNPRTSDRVLRLGLSDAAESWLLPALLRALAAEAPRLRLIAVPVQFRTVGDAFARGAVDAAVTVADELPAGVARQVLHRGSFACVFDPRYARLGRRPTAARYYAQEHVVVSYNGDLRGLIEDALPRPRRVRCAVASFASVGAIVEGSALVATVPAITAAALVRARPRLRAAPLPLPLPAAPLELLWPAAAADDPAAAYLRAQIARVVAASAGAAAARRRRPPPRA